MTDWSAAGTPVLLSIPPSNATLEEAIAAVAAVAAHVQTEDVPHDVMAAISAAVAAEMEEQAPGVPFAITDVKPSETPAQLPKKKKTVKKQRPVWALAGIQQNTTPF